MSKLGYKLGFLLVLCMFLGRISAQTTNNLCINANPFCTDENPYGVSFPAGTDATATPDLSSGQRGCLYYTPAPAWYVMQISDPGDMLIFMSHSGGRDIDFACWGPFTGYSTYGELLQAVCTSQLSGGASTHRPTNGYHGHNQPSTWGGYPSGRMIDCSYSAASTEWCFIPNAISGQWYIFLICNYSRAPGTISFSVQSGEATTNCNILANISNNGPLCEGEDLQLFCNATSTIGYTWTGPNGFISHDQNPIIPNVTEAAAGTYSVEYMPRNAHETQVGTTLVEVYHRPTANISASTTVLCNGEQVTLTGSSDCDDCQYQWSTNSPAHSISVLPTVTTTYTLTVTNGNCSSVAAQTITVGAVPTVAVAPSVITLCSSIGYVDLEAISTQCGTGCTYEWSNAATGNINHVTMADCVPEVDNIFTVTCVNSYGCEAIASAIVRMTENVNVADCNVFYADNYGDPESQGLTPSTPTTVQHAIEQASCTNAIIRLDTGTYLIHQPIRLESNLTLEGGFQDDFKKKTSEVGATTIYRSDSCVEGTSMAPRLVAIEASSLNDFRLQDLTIRTASAPDLPPVRTASSLSDDRDCYNLVEPGTQIANIICGQSTISTYPILPGRDNKYSRYMAIYTAAEMGNPQVGTTFTALGFDVASFTDVPADGQSRHVTIYFLEVPYAGIVCNGSGAPQAGQPRNWNGFLQEATVVYDGYFCVDQTGLVSFPINYDYQGGNLMVLLEGVPCYANGTTNRGCTVSLRGGNANTTEWCAFHSVPPGAVGSSNENFPTDVISRYYQERPNISFYTCTERPVDGSVLTTIAPGSTSATFPLPGEHGHHRTAALYTAAEIGTGAHMLSGIAFDVASIAPEAGRTRMVRIYLKNTTDATLTAGQVWNQYISNATLVYSGTLCEDNTGWITFPAEFGYEGGNLMVMIEGEGCGSTGGCAIGTNCSTIADMCVYTTTDEGAYYSANVLEAVNLRPNIQLYAVNITEDVFYVTESNYGVTTYGLHLANCGRYDIVRCRIIAGNGSDGKNGVDGKAGGDGGAGGAGEGGSNGGIENGTAVGDMDGEYVLGGRGGLGGRPGTTAGTAAAAGAGGNGGNGGRYQTTSPFATHAGGNGTPGGNNLGSQTSGHTNDAQTSQPANNPGVVTAQAQAADPLGQLYATNGTSGVTGAPGTTANPIYNNYFNPGVQVNGQDGSGGSGGGGGGGGGAAAAKNTYGYDTRVALASGCGGSGGGGGGGGGQGGRGGYGGGGSFGVYIYNDAGSRTFTDCYITSGNPGTGGTAGVGGAGGLGGSGDTCRSDNYASQRSRNPDNLNDQNYWASAYGGLGDSGGRGGNGGAGGRGAAGANGISYATVDVPSVGTPTAPANGYSNWQQLVSQRVIIAGSHEKPYSSCTDVDMDMCDEGGGTWYTNFGSEATPANGSACTTIQYSGINSDVVGVTSTGRKTPWTTGASVTNRYSGFNLVLFSPVDPGDITGLSDVCPGDYTYCVPYSELTIGYFYTWSIIEGSDYAEFISDNEQRCVAVNFSNITTETQNVALEVQISPSCCPSFLRDTIWIDVEPMVYVTSITDDLLLCTGDEFDLQVTYTPPEATCQWLLNGNALTGATSSTYSVASADPTNTGEYVAVVTGACNAVLDTVQVTLRTMPDITVTVEEEMCVPDYPTFIFTSNMDDVDVTFTFEGETYTVGMDAGENIVDWIEAHGTGIISVVSAESSEGCVSDIIAQDLFIALNDADGGTSAGRDRTFCGLTGDVEALEPEEGCNGHWELVPGDYVGTLTFDDYTDYHTIVTATAYEEYLICWVAYIGNVDCPYDAFDTTVVRFAEPLNLHFEPGLTSCFGEPIDLTASGSGGDEPYEFFWIDNTDPSNPEVIGYGESMSGLQVGVDYMMIMSDTNGCELDSNFVITLLESQSVSIRDIDTLCPNTDEFSVTIDISQGTPPFQIMLTHGANVYEYETSGSVASYDLPQELTGCDVHDTIYLAVTDHNGCTAYDTAAYVIGDFAEPVIDGVISNDTLGCPGDIPASAATIAELEGLLQGGANTITDNCTLPANLSLDLDEEITQEGCRYTIVRTYTVSDGCDNSSSVTHTIIVADTIAPSVPAVTLSDMTVTCLAEVSPAVETISALAALLEGEIHDNCTADDDLQLQSNTEEFISLCNATYMRTYTITDSCGNSTTVTQQIIFNDNQPPVVEGALSDTVIYALADCSYAGVTAYATVEELAGVTVTDCNLVSEITFVDDNVDPLEECSKNIVRTYTISDSCGNTAELRQNIIVLDTIAPSVVDDLSDTNIYYTDAQCHYADVEVLPQTAFAITDCNDVTMTVSYRDTVGTPGDCSWNFVRVYSFTDACGNGPTIIEQTITVSDTTRPQVTDNLQDTVLYYSGNDCTLENLERLSPEDFEVEDCRYEHLIFSVIERDTTNNGAGCEWSFTRVYTFADDCNNTAVTIDQLITVRDTTRPAISGSLEALTIYRAADCSYELPSEMDIAELQAAGLTITDCNLDETVAVSDGDLDGDNCSATVTRTYTISDLCGNANTITQTIIILDTIHPYWSMPITDSLLTAADCQFVVPDFVAIATNSAADNCTAVEELTITQSVAAGTLVTDAMDVTVTLGDLCGNDTTYTIHLTLPEELMITLNQSDTAICEGQSVTLPTTFTGGVAPYVYNWTPADGLNSTTADTVVATPEDGTYTYEVTITDNNGCTATASVTVTVDTLPAEPTLSSTPDVACQGGSNGTITVENPVGTGYSYSLNGAEFQDTTNVYSGISAGIYTVVVQSNTTNNTNCQATGTVEAESSPTNPRVAIDSLAVDMLLCPNQGTQEITARIISGTEPYVVNWSGATVSTTDSLTATVAVAAENCDSIYEVTITITDGNECEASSTYAFRIVDTLAPVINGTLVNDTVACPNDVAAAFDNLSALRAALVGNEVGIIDSCTAFENLTMRVETADFATSCEYQIVRTYFVEDECGNTSSINHTIIVKDTIAPVITGTLADETVVCAADTSAAVTTVAELRGMLQGGGDISDNCSDFASLTLTATTETFTSLCNATYVRTYTVADSCGNETSITQNIILNDNVAPEIIGTLNDSTIYADSTCIHTLPTASATVADLEAAGLTITDCNLVSEVTFVDADVAVVDNCTNRVVRTYTVTDSCGNTSTIDQNINIQDTIHPWMERSIADSLLTGTNCEFAVPDFVAIAATLAHDNCTAQADIVIVQDPVAGTPVTTDGDVTLTLTDACGLQSTFTVHYVMPTMPVVTLLQSDTSLCEGQSVTLPTTLVDGTAPFEYAWLPTDGLDNPTAETVVATPAAGTYAYVVTVTDANGCTTTATVTVEVDTIPAEPTLTQTPNIACHGGANGTITIENPVGTGYSYSLNNAAFQDTTNVYEGLMQGNYTVEVMTNAPAACRATATIEVESSPAIPSVAIDTIRTAMCPNQGTQIVTAQINSGIEPFAVTWTNAAIDATDSLQAVVTFDNTVCDSNYSITISITDGNGCETHNEYVFLVADSLAPVMTDFVDTLRIEGCDVTVAPAELTTEDELTALGMTFTDECTQPGNFQVRCVADTNGSCPIVITRRYTVVDECGHESGEAIHRILINDETAPEVTVAEVVDTINSCGEQNAPAVATTPAELTGIGFAFADACTANDDLVVNSTSETALNGCTVEITRRYTVTDACQNVSAEMVHVIRIHDSIAPEITGAFDDVTFYGCDTTTVLAAYPMATTTAEMLALGGINITDACTDVTDLIVHSRTDSTGLCEIIVTRTYWVEDACGNLSNEVTQTIHILDTFAPVVDYVLNDTTIYYTNTHCDYDEVAQLSQDVFGAQDCHNVTMTVAQRDTVGAPGDCEWSFVRDYMFADECGNGPVIISHNIIVKDTARPQVVDNLLDTILHYSGNDCTLEELPRLQLTDFNVEDCRYDHLQFTVVEQDTTNMGMGCEWTYTRVYTFADDCNNTSVSIDQLITVRDTTRPAIGGTLADLSIYRLEDCSYILPDTMTMAELQAALRISDCNLNEDNVEIAHSDLDGDNCNGLIIRTYTISDLCGNTNTISQNITVSDTTRPYLTEEIADSLLTATNCDFVVPDFVAIATGLAHDNCSAVADMTITQSVAAGTPVTDAMDVTVTLTDACSNSSSYTIHITLPEVLTIALHQGDTAICEGESVTLPTTFAGGTAPFTYSWLPTDGLNVNDADTVVATPAAGVYAYEVTITDANGCTATASATVTVDTLPAVPTLTSAPNVACHGDANGSITVENPTGTGYTYSLDGDNFQASNVFEGLADSAYVVTVLTAEGCQSTGNITVDRSPAIPAVSIDSLAADLLLCPNQGAQEITARILNGLAPYVVTWTGAAVSATDSLTATVDIDANACNTEYTVTVSIVDDNECEAHSTYVFSVVDTLAPVITGIIPNDTFACPNAVPAQLATLSDLLNALQGDGTSIVDACTTFDNLVMTVETADFTQSCDYQIVRTYSVTDECGNTSSITHTIIVHDTIAPVITGTLADETVVCAADFSAEVATVAALRDLLQGDGASITDNCSDFDALTLTSSTEEFTALCHATYVRTYTVTDSCGNSSSITQNLIINDNVAPEIVGTLADTTIYADSACGHVLPAALTTVDELTAVGLTITDCNIASEVTSVEAAMTAVDNCNNLIVRTYTISDSCGNSSTIDQNIYIQDTIHPWMQHEIADTLLVSTDCHFLIPDFAAVAATLAQDNCTANADIVVSQDVAAGTEVTAATDVTLTLTDACGLSSTYVIHVTIPEELQIVINQNDTAFCEGGQVTLPTTVTGGIADYSYNWTPTDGLDDANVAAPVCTAVEGVYNYEVTVTDANGCTATAAVDVTIWETPDTATYTISPNTLCEGGYNGEIHITSPLGADYLYSLGGGEFQTEPSFTELMAGTYTVAVQTVHGCNSQVINVVLPNADNMPNVTIQVTDAEVCPNAGTQTVVAVITGGDEPYYYDWQGEAIISVNENEAYVGIDAAECDTVYSFMIQIADVNNCAATAYATITSRDVEAPSINGELDTVRMDGCSPDDLPVAANNVVYFEDLGIEIGDNCTSNENIVVTFEDDVTPGCPIEVVRTYMFTDECGLTSNLSQVYYIQDIVAPVAGSYEVEVDVNGCSLADIDAPVTTVGELNALGFNVSDDCTDVDGLVLTVSQAIYGQCPVAVERKYVVSDACQNASDTLLHTIFIYDDNAPTITGTLTDRTIDGCDIAALGTDTLVHTVAALQALGLQIVEDCTPDSMRVIATENVEGTCPMVITRTYVVEDLCGNPSEVISQTIFIQDTTAPVISGLLTEMTLTSASCEFLVPDFADEVLGHATDNCSSVLTYSQSIAEGTALAESTDLVVTVTDDCQNSVSSTIHLVVPEELAISINEADTGFCEGGSMTLTTTVTGGTPDFAYSWQPVAGLDVTDASAVTATPGEGRVTYEVFIVDANECEASASIDILVYETPTPAEFTVVNNTMCTGDPNGSITITSPIGNQYEYSINGTDYQSAPEFNGLDAGTYTISVRTNEGCMAEDVTATIQTIQNWPTVSLSRRPNHAVECPSIGTINITATVANGSPDFIYTWTGTTTADQTTATLDVIPSICDTTYEVTVYVEDIYNCSAEASITIVARDAEGPQIQAGLPLDTAVYYGCSVDVAPAAITRFGDMYRLSAALMIGDNCGLTNNSELIHRDSVTGSCPIEIHRFYQILDKCGNPSAPFEQVILIYDDEAPVVTASTITTNVNGCTLDAAPAVITTTEDLMNMGYVFSDNCTANENMTVACDADTSETVCPMVIVRFYSVIDECGNQSNNGLVNIIQVFDSVAPVISGNIAAVDIDGCDTTALVNYAAVTTSAELQALGITINEECSDVEVFSDYTADGECPIVVTRNYWVVDECGNVSNTVSQTINIQDHENPTFTADIPEQYLVGQGGQFFVPDLTDAAMAVASDNCTPADQITVTQEPAAGTLVTHDQNVTVVIYDNCQNSASIEVPVILPDVLQIEIVQDDARFCLGDSIALTPVVRGGSAPYEFAWTPADGGLNAYDVQDVVATPAVGTHVYWVTVTDFNGSTASDSVTIIVDSIPAIPQLASTGNTICAGDPNGAITVVAPIGDGYTYSLDGGDYQPEQTFNGLAAGIYTVTVQTPAGCTSEPAEVEVLEESAAPVVTIVATLDTLCPNIGTYTLTAEIVGGEAPFNFTWTGNGVADANDLTTTLTVDATACNTMYVSNISVTDANNCDAADVDTVYVRDTEIPTITGTLDVVTYNGCTSEVAPAAVTTPAELEALGLTLADNCTAPDALTVNVHANVEGICPIVITRYYTVTDACGNVSEEFIHTLQVLDQDAPQVLNALVETNINGCDETAAPAVVATPADLQTLGFDFNDACTSFDALQVVSLEEISGTCPTIITRKYVVKDECQNVSDTMTHIITILDETAPVINGTIADVTVDGCSLDDIADRPVATTVDELIALGVTITESCDAQNMTLQNDETVTFGCPTVVVRTYTVSDACGNVSNEVTETITIQDVTAPVFASQVEEHLLASANCQFVVPNLIDEVRAVSSDNCLADANDLIITQNPAEGTAVNADMTVDVTVADTCGNISVMTIQLRLPVSMTLNISPSTTQYCEWDVISLTAEPEGGNGDYTYEWTPATGLQSTTDAIVQVNTVEQNYTYHLLATDGNGCTATADITLPEPSHLTVDAQEQSAINCFQGSDGVVIATADNGVPAYNYEWSNGTNTAVASNLAEGTYTVTATDAYGCTASADITINHPTELTGTVSNETAVLCFGDANGSGTIAPAGGTAPYTVSVDNNATVYPVAEGGEYTFTGLAADTYTVLVTDANGCAFNTSMTITSPDLLVLTETATTMPLCNQGVDGTATVNAVGGTLPYTVSVDGVENATMNAAGDQLITDLAAGTYTVGITDANGCATQITVTINEPDPLQLAQVSVENVSCNGFSDGTATTTMTGGTAPYTLWINNNEQTTTVAAIQNVTFVGLPAGTHTVTVQDVNGCTTTLPVTLSEPNTLTIAADNATAVQCFGDANGSIHATPAEGTAPYTLSIDNFVTSQTVPAGGSYTFTGLAAGTYTVAVRDAHGCEADVAFTITTPDELTLAEVSTTDPLCFQGTDGEVTVAMAGGVAPYSLSVDGTTFATNLQAGNQTVNNLAAGSHAILVQDANGCTAAVTSTLGEPALLALAQGTITPITCHDGDDGTVSVSVTGGTAAYNVWIDASLQQQTLTAEAQNASFTGMNGGEHIVTVVDDHQCTATLAVSFVNPEPMNTEVNATTDVLCFNEENGTATFTISGGTLPYTVTVDPTIPDITLNNEDAYTINTLWAATYNVGIVDAHGCTADMQFVIGQPDTLTAQARVVNDVFCFGNTDGNATASATGGIAPYGFAWDPDHTDANLDNVGAGFYVVTVSDYNGCIARDTAFINEPEMLSIELVTLTESCNGEETAVIEIDAHGGTPDYEYIWSNGATTDSIFNLAVGPYSVTVTDANGCPDTMTVVVPFHALPDFTVSVTDAYCDRPDGTATVVGSNTQNYSYNWHADNNPDAPFNDALTGGNYVLTVDDGVCTLDIPFSINNVPGPTANLTADPVTFIEGATVRYHDFSTGSIVNWFYDFGDANTSNASNPSHLFTAPGEYNTVLTVTDEHNCVDTAAVTITVIPDVIIYIPNAFTPNEDGINDVWRPIMDNYGSDLYELLIYNRWGQLIFKSNEPLVGWDGTVNGQEATPAVYVYSLTYQNLMGKKLKKEGTVTLIR